jgi:hypothetical protein
MKYVEPCIDHQECPATSKSIDLIEDELYEDFLLSMGSDMTLRLNPLDSFED